MSRMLRFLSQFHMGYAKIKTGVTCVSIMLLDKRCLGALGMHNDLPTSRRKAGPTEGSRLAVAL